MTRSRRPMVYVPLAAVLLVGLAATPVPAAERVVTDCGDTVPGGGPGQLRRLINDAGEGDVILIPACTITLQGVLNLATTLTLQGAGPSRTILDGGAQDRVLQIFPAAVVGVSGLTVRNGRADFGGGLVSYGTLDLTNVEVTGNEATFGGGGIYLWGGGNHLAGSAATFSHVTVADNVAYDGGGLFVDGDSLLLTTSTVNLVNVTLSGNRARSYGGGIFATLGALVTTLNNVSIVANQANIEGIGGLGGGGGGLVAANGATLVLRNTLVAGNTVESGEEGPDCVVVSGTLQSLGANLIEQVTATCTLTGLTATNLTGSAPGVGPLADNGGPTRTHALLPGSLALEHGDGACAAVDQRGVPRPQNGRCDIGAFERRGRGLDYAGSAR